MKLLRYCALSFTLAFFASSLQAQTIPNPSFEVDHFANGVGYVSENSAITGWVASNPARIGLNLNGVNNPGLLVDNGAIPNGTNAAFIQATANTTNTLSTTITGLTPGVAYRVTFRANHRLFYEAGTQDWSLNGGAFVPFTSLPAVGASNPYYTNSAAFLATTTTAALVLRNGNTNGDATVLVDNFSITQALVVNNTNDGGTSSLRQAVLNLATLPGTNTITFASALSGATITLASEIVLSHNVTIDASSLAGGITLSGGDATRIFTVNNGQTVSMLGLTVVHGYADFGGAIESDGTLALAGCTFSKNSADNGGVIWNKGVMTITRSTFSDNQSTFQSGAIQNQGALTMTNCILMNNRCGSLGGALLNIEVNSTSSLMDCTLSGNSAGLYGGAIFNDISTTSSLTHCTLSGNSSVELGGGIFIFGGTVALTHCTLSGNSGNLGGGGIYIYVNPAGAILTNCIVSGNISPIGADLYKNASGTLIRGGANIISVSAGSAGSGPVPITANPLLAPLGNYGGPTQTMPPLPGSPALDAASVVVGLTTDQRGSVRAFGVAPDIGAVESSGLWVENLSNTGSGSLRGVLLNANSVTNAKTVIFTPILSGGIIPLASEIILSNNVSIDAGGLPSGLTLSGGNATRIFTLPAGQTASLSSLTLTGGNGVGGDAANIGGAIKNGGRLSLARCALYGNSSTTGGGAIANPSGLLTLLHCTLSGNSGLYGGALQNSFGTITLTHCTLALNHSTGTDFTAYGGGAIDNYNNAALTLTACILAGNTSASASGPDLWMENGPLTATYCLIGNGTSSTLTNGASSNLVGTGVAPVNALLAPLGNYGGPTQTMPPLPGSPAIDAGANASVTDQRWYPGLAGLAADIGAVEGIYNAAGPGYITGITRLTNGFVRIGFTNLTDASFPVFASTNIGLAATNWTMAGFAAESPVGSGKFQFTDTPSANYQQRFYRLRSP